MAERLARGADVRQVQIEAGKDELRPRREYDGRKTVPLVQLDPKNWERPFTAVAPPPRA